jgi:protoporphyrinogen oxidase
MKKYDIVIAGAGISGLCLAHFCLKKGMTALVIESSERMGGAFNSHKLQGNTQDGFWLELGAHTCYNSYSTLLQIVEDCGLLTSLIPRAKVPFRVLVDGQIKTITSQLNFLELALSLPRLFGAKKKGVSVKDYYSSILGKRNFNHLFSHFFNAVPSQDASDFPADMLFKKRDRRKDIVRSFTFKDGLESVAKAISQQKGIDIICNQQITKLETNKQQYTSVTKQGNSYQSKYVGLATSAQQAAQIVLESKPELAHELQKISAERIDSVGVKIDQHKLQLEPVAGIVPLNGSFFSAVSRDTVPDQKYRGFTFHFKGGTMSENERLKVIEDALRIDKSKIQEMVTCQNLVTSPRLGHEAVVRQIDTLLNGEKILVTGNYFKGVSIEDCLSRSKKEAKRILL